MRAKLSPYLIFGLLSAAVVFLSFRLVQAFINPSGNPTAGGGAVLKVDPTLTPQELQNLSGFVYFDYSAINGKLLGVGVTDPVSMLDVFGVASFGSIMVNNPSQGITVGSTLIKEGGSTIVGDLTLSASGNLIIPEGVIDVKGPGRSYFAGNVGIGVGAPGARLDILNATADNLLKLSRTGGTYSTLFKLGTDNALIINNSNEDTLTLKSGNVGIGTTDPTADLDVVGADVYVRAYKDGDEFAYLRSVGVIYAARGTNNFQIDAQPGGAGSGNPIALIGNANLRITANNTSHPNQLYLGSGGNVGIGTTDTASAKLTISPGSAAAAINAGDRLIIGIETPSGLPGTSNYAATVGYVNTVVTTNMATNTPKCTAADPCEVFGINVIPGGSGNISGVTKLTAQTIDPLYSISGEKYATYVASMTGVKEETTGILFLNEVEGQNSGIYKYEIDFDKTEKSSDLWLFREITDFGPNWENLSVLLTPSFEGKVWYEKDPVSRKLTIYANTLYPKPYTPNPEISYRLTAPRFDHLKWPNISNDSSSGLFVK